MLVSPESKDYLSALMIANGFQLNVVTEDLQRYAIEDDVFRYYRSYINSPYYISLHRYITNYRI